MTLASRKLIPFGALVIGAFIALVYLDRGSDKPAPATTTPIVVQQPFEVVSDTLHSGEAISTLLARQGVVGIDFAALAQGLRFDPRSLRADLAFSFHRDARTGEASRFEFRPDSDQRFRFILTSSGWEGESLPVHWTTDTILVSGAITNSLYESVDDAVSEATLDAGARQALVHELANVNAWSVDFSRDPQPGDPFKVVVERKRNDEGEVRFGRVLASDLTINGQRLQAFRFVAADGKPGYYDAAGKALKREFLAAPVEFRYITRALGRMMHPILHTRRAHNGIDYSAARGTPVHAAANGVVILAGRSGGYGNLVELRHRNGITTRYGHLSRITPGLRKGMSVTQGEVIGRVGSTGMSTAPHLHYEFRVKGKPVDPRRMKMDAGEPLSPSDRPSFNLDRNHLLDLLGESAGESLKPQLAD